MMMIGEVFFWNGENLRYDNQDNCVPSIIQHKRALWIQTSVHPAQLFFTKTINRYLIVISKEEIRFNVLCPHCYFIIKDSIMFRIPINLTFKYTNNKFELSQTNNLGNLILPKDIQLIFSQPPTQKGNPLKAITLRRFIYFIDTLMGQTNSTSRIPKIARNLGLPG